MITLYNTVTYTKISLKEFLLDLSQIEKSSQYIQAAAGFDIETSSFLMNDEKLASMYIWQFACEDNIVYGRTWNEFEDFIMQINHYLYTSNSKLIVFIHNASYEFQWVQSHITISSVFAREKRKVIYFTSGNIEFRCSYFLTNKSLRVVAKENHLQVTKKYMDYSLKRFWFTPLTDDELEYSIDDVKILVEYIRKEITRNGTVQNIPLTQTGYVRRFCIEYIKEHTNWSSYKRKISNISPKRESTFILLRKAFTGGYTHANYINADITLEDVFSDDFNSSYPAVMVRKKFPMSLSPSKPENFFLELKKGRAIVMKCAFINVRNKTSNSLISVNKCVNERNVKIDNGRVLTADYFELYLTDLDYRCMEMVYDFELKVIEMESGIYEYLPAPLVHAIIELYKYKTTLKGIPEDYSKYMAAKEMLNSSYGMSVTNPISEEVEYDDIDYSWFVRDPEDIEGNLKKYYDSYNTFLVYQWGVWVTAWARYELISTFMQFPDDVVYCDTDSVKFINSDNKKYFDKKNLEIIEELKLACRIQKIKWEDVSPLTKKGQEKTLGLWEAEPAYKWFKTLGAKRYCYSYYDEYYDAHKEDFIYEDSEGNLHQQENFFTTVSGISKVALATYLSSQSENSPFDLFTDNLTVPEDKSGRLNMQYICKPFSIEVEDYLGNSGIVEEDTYMYAESTTFSMSVTDDYAILLGLANTQDTKRSTRLYE